MRTSKTVSDYMVECEARGLAAATIDQYRWALGRMVSKCGGIPRDGKQLLLALADSSLSPESRKDLVKCWRTFFNWYIRQDHHSRRPKTNPVDELKSLPRKQRLPRVLTSQEVRQLIAAADNERDRVLVLLVMDCGLRLGEISGLKWTDVRDDHLVVNGKVGDRLVPISHLMRLELDGQGDGQHVWLGCRGPLTKWGVQTAFRKLFQRAKIGTRKAGPHCLRHTFATSYVAAGGNLAALKEILGHTKLATTQRYVTLARTQVCADHARFSPIATMGLIRG